MRAIAVLYLAACAHRAAPTPDRQPLAWLDGAWHGETLDEQFVTAGAITYGVTLANDGFEVVMITGHELLGMANGRDAQHLQATDISDGNLRFGKLGFFRIGERLEISNGDQKLVLAAGPPARSAELEAVDAQFSSASQDKGPDAWVAIMAQDGALWREDRRVERDAVRETVMKTLEKGILTWSPTASGVRGDLGFTVGRYEFRPRATPTLVSSGTYCSVWKREAGGWKLLFDLGS